jgi:hypothetical protein
MAGIPLVLLWSLAALLTGAVSDGGAGRRAASREDSRPLPFFYDLYTFRGTGGATAVVGAFAVEAGELETEYADGRVRYRFSVTLALADTVRRVVFNTHDTVFVDVPAAIPDEHLLYTHVEVRAPPSRSVRHRVVMIDAVRPGIGQLYTEPFIIPDYRGDTLMISDIALGQPGTTTGWKRGDAALALLPTSRFPASAFDVYYEIYNLPARRPYTTTITIEPLPSAEVPMPLAEPVQLRFAAESRAGSDHVHSELRHVEASLGRGRYRLTATIIDHVTGRSASRSRTFDVRRDGVGATMVPALPTSREPPRR